MNEYFEELKSLLSKERDEDLAQYQALMKDASIADKRANGYTWYPVAIRNNEPTKADYLKVELERTTHHDQNHQFKTGVTARFYSNHDAAQYFIDGSVKAVLGNKIVINIPADELPDWASEGKLGVDILFDEQGYKEMFYAIKTADALVGKNELVDVLIGNKAPQFVDNDEVIQNDKLNISQDLALNKVLNSQQVSVVHGPPGTGKTTTLVEIVKALTAKGEKILATAPSNTAIDLLCEKLHLAGVKVLRVGNPNKINDNLLAVTQDEQVAKHPYFKDIKKFKLQAREYTQMAHKYKRNFGPSERAQKKLLFDEAKKLMIEAEKLEQYIIDQLNETAQVIAGTPIGLNNALKNNSLTFDSLIIDEAAQALEPTCWLTILKAKKVIFAGDHQQLPPTIKNKSLQKQLGCTLMEKLVHLYPQAVTMLNVQYRMHEDIMKFSSQYFYDNLLQAHESVSDKLLFNEDLSIEFIDTAGCGFEEKVEGTSISNPDEALLVYKHLSQYLISVPNLKNIQIGVISPYRQQLLHLNESLTSLVSKNLTINTVDAFQGQEKEIIYVSLVRSNANGEIGFLHDHRRINVAMTRAKHKLVLIGDSATLCKYPFYEQLVSFIDSKNGYKTAWEF